MVMTIKRGVVFVSACLASQVAMAQGASPDELVSATSLVPPAASRDAQAEGIDLSKMNVSPGVHIVDLANSPFNGPAAEKVVRELGEQARLGSYTADVPIPDLRGTVTSGKRRSRRSVNALDRSYASIAEARPHLQFEPAPIKGSRLEDARLLDVATGGGIKDGRWSGVTRTWDVAGLGTVRLDESEFKETGGSITVVREWLNAAVRGRPATVKTMRSTDGKVLVSVSWLSDTTDYRLDLQPLDATATKANEGALLALANQLGGV
jgi:hypothetical protein